jgi:TonB family protein
MIEGGLGVERGKRAARWEIHDFAEACGLRQGKSSIWWRREGKRRRPVLFGAIPTIMKTPTLFLLLAASVVGVSGARAQPAATDYVPMKVIQTVAPIYPRTASELGLTEGETHVSIQIDSEGHLTDYVVTAYSHPAFAERSVDAIKQWRYEPAYLDGQARGATVDLTFHYKSKGIVIVDLSVNSYLEVRRFEIMPNALAYRACTLRELDRIPTPSKIVKPVYPQELAGRHPVSVTVDFYIDEKGHVRLPAVSRESIQASGELAAAAVNAVAQWEFEPPLSKGRPVLVLARQVFTFQAADTETPPAPPVKS